MQSARIHNNITHLRFGNARTCLRNALPDCIHVLIKFRNVNFSFPYRIECRSAIYFDEYIFIILLCIDIYIIMTQVSHSGITHFGIDSKFKKLPHHNVFI